MSQATSLHILLITRHYPPEVSGGARRPSAFVGEMRKRGHRVTVVTPFELNDPDHVHVFNAAIDRGYQASLIPTDGKGRPPNMMQNVKSWARRWAYWPDPNIGWAKAVVANADVKELRPDLVMTTSPSESTHWAGMTLASVWGYPWVAEFRDTWIANAHRVELNHSPLRRWVETRLARRWLQSVSAVIGVSEAVLSDIRALVPVDTPCVEIGHSATPMAEAESKTTLRGDRINIVHTGGFSNSDPKRSLAALLDVLATKAVEPPLCLHLAGTLSDAEIVMIEAAPVDVRHHGQLSLDRSRDLQQAADALLLCVPDGSHAIPGKLAEYWQTQAPILRFGYSPWVETFPEGALEPLETALSGLRKGMAVTGRDDRFSLSHAMNGYDALIRTVVRGGISGRT